MDGFSGPAGGVLDEWMSGSAFHIFIELLLVVSIVWLFFSNRYRQKVKQSDPLTPKEQDELLAEWQPEPLCAPLKEPLRSRPVAESAIGTHVQVQGRDMVNAATFNYLGMVAEPRVEAAAVASIQRYGVGSCGPRGFYGTIDVHLQLEEALARFLGAEEAILYSYGFSTIASAIPAYSKRGDILYIDDAACLAIQKGAVASRSKVVRFRHNDMADLEAKLAAQAETDKKDPEKAKATRRFIVVEGLYINTGNICPLDKLIELKYKYKTRLMVEESHSFGVLGENGRGVVEHFGANVEDVDCMAASMGSSLGSIGGFCAGRRFVIDHQRLSGQGYCYSASLPPLLAEAASVSLGILDGSEGRERLARLRANSKELRALLAKLKDVAVGGDALSPLLHVRLTAAAKDRLGVAGNARAEDHLLAQIADKALEDDVVLTTAAYIFDDEVVEPNPSIRLAVSADHTKADLEAIAKSLSNALAATSKQ